MYSVPLREEEGAVVELQVEEEEVGRLPVPVEVDDEGHGQAVEDGVLDVPAGEDEAHGVDAHQVADQEAHQEGEDAPGSQARRTEEPEHCPRDPDPDIRNIQYWGQCVSHMLLVF